MIPKNPFNDPQQSLRLSLTFTSLIPNNCFDNPNIHFNDPQHSLQLSLTITPVIPNHHFGDLSPLEGIQYFFIYTMTMSLIRFGGCRKLVRCCKSSKRYSNRRTRGLMMGLRDNESVIRPGSWCLSRLVVNTDMSCAYSQHQA